MDVLNNLLFGFSVALTPSNLAYAFIGVIVGNLVGVLPGLGPPTAIAVLLPVTFGMDAASAIIMLSAIYYGAMYGGTITSVLLNIPGEAASVVTTFDGYQMARQGRAGAALSMAAFGSFIAGTLGVVGLMLIAKPLVQVALSFSSAEYALVMGLALMTVSAFAGKSILKALMMAILGLAIGTVGTEPISGVMRFTFGRADLYDGIGLIPMIMGVFGLSEVLINTEEYVKRDVFQAKMGRLLPTMADWAACKWSILRGGLIGFALGIFPGVGATLPTFVSYAAEKRFSKRPERFGTGAIEGVAGPESSNNSAAVAAMVPMLALGIPSSSTTAVLIGALIMYGIRPGPLMFEKYPDVAWGLIASMYVGNIMLVILNVPLISIWVRMLRVPYSVMTVLITIFVFTGSYSNNGMMSEVWMAVAFGVLGYLMRKCDLPPAPLIPGMVLGPMLEEHVRRALIFSNGDWSTFVTRPISGFLLGIAILILVSPLLKTLWHAGREHRSRQAEPATNTPAN